MIDSLTMRRNRDGSYDVRVDAVGGEAQMCTGIPDVRVALKAVNRFAERFMDLPRSDYSVVYAERPAEGRPGFVGLIDEDAGSLSVTNDAERVVVALAERFPVDKCVILYRDTEGFWDRIETGNERFVGFSAVRGKSFEEARKLVLQRLGHNTEETPPPQDRG